MNCAACGGTRVEWQGPPSALTHTQCLDCGRTGTQKPEPPPAPEFGHHHAAGAGFLIDGWGAGPFCLHWKGRNYWFEFSDRFGPSLTDRFGEVLAKQPDEQHPFWTPFHWWLNQGRRVDGTHAVFEIPPDPRPNFCRRVMHRGRVRTEVFHCGDGDGPYYVVDPFKVIGGEDA